MKLEEIGLDVRTYNAVKRFGCQSAEQLASMIESEKFRSLHSGNLCARIADALKKAGAVCYIRGDSIPAEALGQELELPDLQKHTGEILAMDISTESAKWYRAVTVIRITQDRILFRDSYRSETVANMSIRSYQNRKNDRIRPGGFFLISGKAAPAADESVSAEIVPAEKAAPAAPEDAHAAAVRLHHRIRADKQMIEETLWDMCKSMKEMRDGKHYQALLYANFEAYCEAELGYSRAQAYRFITIAENYTEENVSSMRQIGITKLALLAAVDEEQREQIVQNTDLTETTVRELREQIAQLAADRDALAAERQREGLRADRLAREAREKEDRISSLSARVSEQTARIDELESRPVEVAVQPDEAAMEQLRAQHRAEIAQLKQRHQAQLAELQQPRETVLADIRQGQFSAKHSVLLTAAEDLMAFLSGMEMSGNPQAAVFIEKTKKSLRGITAKLNDIIMKTEDAS